MYFCFFKEIKVIEIGLGTWQSGSPDWGSVNNAAAFNILHSLFNVGGNFIDTANVFRMGISEQVIGRFLETVDQEIQVATKLR